MIDLAQPLAPGVRGYTVDMGEQGLYIPLIDAEAPGSGDVGRYLDSLPKDRRVVVPNVISARLAGMLDRRGFVVVQEWAEQFGEYVECYVRESAS